MTSNTSIQVCQNDGGVSCDNQQDNDSVVTSVANALTVESERDISLNDESGNHASTSKIDITFNDLITTSTPVQQPDKKVKKRRIAHAEIITSSPFKNILKQSKDDKREKEAVKAMKQRKTANQKAATGQKSRKKPGTHNKQDRPKQLESGQISDDEPLVNLLGKAKSTKPKTTTSANECAYCKYRYGDPNDPNKHLGWIQCDQCEIWLHDLCAETYGVFGDIDYLCKNCV